MHLIACNRSDSHCDDVMWRSMEPSIRFKREIAFSSKRQFQKNYMWQPVLKLPQVRVTACQSDGQEKQHDEKGDGNILVCLHPDKPHSACVTTHLDIRNALMER